MEMTSSRSRVVRGAGALLGCLGLAGCVGPWGGERGMPEGPFLSAGPILMAEYPGRPSSYPGAAAAADRATQQLPDGLVGRGGRERLSGGRYPGIGPLGAVVLPVSVGNTLPMHDNAAIARDLMGEDGEEEGVRGLIERESGGMLRFASRTLPLLVAPELRGVGGRLDARELERIAAMVLATWAERIDLSIYDNNGPDGVPASADDDGVLDLVIVPIESATPFESQILHVDREVRSRARKLRSGPILVVHVPRDGSPDVIAATRLVLHSLGLGEEECFFPEGFGRTVSSLARTRLGWLPAAPVAESAIYPVPEGRGIMVPVVDLPQRMGFWLIEREAGRIYLSRVVRHAAGQFLPTRVEQMDERHEKVLPLTRQFGERGPRLRVSWDQEAAEPRLEVVLAEERSAETAPLQPIRRLAPPARRAVPAGIPTSPLDP